MNWRSPNSSPVVLIPLQRWSSYLLSLWERPGEGLLAAKFATSLRNSTVPRWQLPRFQEFETSSSRFSQHPAFFRLGHRAEKPSSQRTKRSASIAQQPDWKRAFEQSDALPPVRSSTAPWHMILKYTILVKCLKQQSVVVRSPVSTIPGDTVAFKTELET